LKRLVVAGAVAALSGLALGGCPRDGAVAPVRPQRPARSDDCPVQVFSSGPPSYPVVGVATTRTRCYDRREDCLGRLRPDACAAGADTIYVVAESVRERASFFTVELAVRAPPAADLAGRPRPTIEATCVPICSPGFACRAGQCVPECNPSCEAGEICTRRRICAPAPAAPGAPPDDGSPP
jgi:hypothetical protein